MDKHSKLKSARQAARLSQEDLAKAAGIAQSQLSRMEKGDKWASADVLERIANTLNIPIYNLFDIDLLQPRNKDERTDTPEAIIKSAKTPTGLSDLAKDSAMHKAIDIKPMEWHFLATLQLPAATDKSGYIAILTSMRGVTRS